MRQKLQLKSDYAKVLKEVVGLLESARRASARTINTIMTAAYWGVGRRIVEFEQKGKKRAEYGEELMIRLSTDLTARFGRGFGLSQVKMMRQFYLFYPPTQKSQSAINQSGKSQSVIGQSLRTFPLSWTHYAQLLRVTNEHARTFYELEALRGGWSVRQLSRQIGSLFYERTALSRNKVAMLKKGKKAILADRMTAEEEIKDPFVLEFLGLKDEYSESALEEALIRHLEAFLLELGGDFTFVGRQRRLRVGDAWYRVDLLFFHRRLRCLVVIDLKIGEFTHADAGQMHLYLNYVREHWMCEGENPPVGLILCAQKDNAVARYALEGLPNKVMAAEYRMALPKETMIAAEVEKTKIILESRIKPT